MTSNYNSCQNDNVKIKLIISFKCNIKYLPDIAYVFNIHNIVLEDSMFWIFKCSLRHQIFYYKISKFKLIHRDIDIDVEKFSKEIITYI